MFIILEYEEKINSLFSSFDDAKKRMIELWNTDDDFKYKYTIKEYILNDSEYKYSGVTYILQKFFGEDFKFVRI
jgi:hypothetical protein